MRRIDADALIDAINKWMPNQEEFMESAIPPIENLAVSVLMTIEEQPTVDAEPRWIPVSERLPKQGQEVICQCRANIIRVLKLDANGNWYQDAEHCYLGGFVIAWMPLPKPYQEEKC